MEGWPGLAGALAELGMWQDLPYPQANAERQRVAAGGFPFRLLPAFRGSRWFFVDGEEMAEGEVERKLTEMAPALAALGLELSAELVRSGSPAAGGDYVVAVNGRECVVWTPEDWAGQRARETATVRPLALVNTLLAEAGVRPRFFTLYAGLNEGVAWLLDPRVVDAVRDSGLIAADEIPALAALFRPAPAAAARRSGQGREAG